MKTKTKKGYATLIECLIFIYHESRKIPKSTNIVPESFLSLFLRKQRNFLRLNRIQSSKTNEYTLQDPIL